MPYIITTRRSAKQLAPGQSTFDETAVATLDEARDHVTGLVPFPQFGHKTQTLVGNDLSAMRESGGTIGPLPDGTVIEVRHVDWIAMRKIAGGLSVRMYDRLEVLAAFNAS